MTNNNATDLIGAAAAKTSSNMLMLEGVVLIVLGTIAILVPVIFTLAVETLVGAVLVIGGLVRGYSAFKAPSTRSVMWSLIAALVAIVAGVLLLVFPLDGVLTLTAVVIALLIIEGVTKIVASFQINRARGWGWLLFTGILDLALGFILWIGLPGTALWAIGLLVGISLIFTGWTAVMFAGAMKSTAKGS
jgi:uncharacterized membrane protein HdeD (DUF308 family)